MKTVNWPLVGMISIVVLLILFGGGMMLGGWGYRGWSMMGFSARVGVNDHSGYSSLGQVGMALMWLIPVGLLVLAALGFIWLVRNIDTPFHPPPD